MCCVIVDLSIEDFIYGKYKFFNREYYFIKSLLEKVVILNLDFTKVTVSILLDKKHK